MESLKLVLELDTSFCLELHLNLIILYCKKMTFEGGLAHLNHCKSTKHVYNLAVTFTTRV